MASGAPSFRVGKKEVFLPNACIAFLRSTTLAANQARFRVPLKFSKLDLRDYLYHAYNVEILNVRSYVKQSPVRAGNPAHNYPARHRWHRPRAQKIMTVELVKPFVWPEEPENYDEWNEKEAKMAEKEQDDFGEETGSLGDARVNKERRVRMREQARELLEGRVKWKPGVSKSVGLMGQERK